MKRYFKKTFKAIKSVNGEDTIVTTVRYWASYRLFYLYGWDRYDKIKSVKIPENGTEDGEELAKMSAEIISKYARAIVAREAKGENFRSLVSKQFVLRYEDKQEAYTPEQAEKIGLDKFVEYSTEGGAK